MQRFGIYTKSLYLCNMSNWKYKNKVVKSIEDMPEGVLGIIYSITNTTRKKAGLIPYKYLGRKVLYNESTKIISKREKELTGNNRKKKKVVIKESNWQDYTGSNVDLNNFILEGDKIEKTILMYCFSKRELNYQEVKWMFKFNVIEEEEYFNSNINGCWFRNNLR